MRYSQTITIVITLRSNKILPSSLTVSTNAACGAVSFGKVNTFIPLKERMLKKYFRFLHFYTAGRQGDGCHDFLYIIIYIDGQTGIGKKWGLMYRLATLHQWPSSSINREKQLIRKTRDRSLPFCQQPLPRQDGSSSHLPSPSGFYKASWASAKRKMMLHLCYSNITNDNFYGAISTFLTLQR